VREEVEDLAVEILRYCWISRFDIGTGESWEESGTKLRS